MKYRIFIQNLIGKFINRLIKFSNLIPNRNFKDRIVKKLIKLKNRINPTLWDNDIFLSYVAKKKIGLDLNSHRIKTLALRGSTADYSFHPNFCENSFNMGLTSMDLFSTYHLYKNIRNNLPELKNIILYAGVFLPGYSVIKTNARYITVSYKFFFNIPYEKEELINKKYERWIYNKCKKLSTLKVIQEYRGYEKKTDFINSNLTNERVVAHLRENKREPNQLFWMQHLSNLINADNRRLFVVLPPFRSDYRSLLPEKTIIYEKLFQLKNIDFLDYHNSEFFDDGDFGDSDHLNEKGAKKLTNEIYELLKNKNIL